MLVDPGRRPLLFSAQLAIIPTLFPPYIYYSEPVLFSEDDIESMAFISSKYLRD